MTHIVDSQAKFSQRLVCLDLVKGLAILQFILWHVFQNFYASAPSTAALHRILFSVTGFFVLSSGFLVGFHYYENLQLSKEKDSLSIFKRLCIRAMKLFIIVLIANLTIHLISNGFSSTNILFVLNKILSLFYIDRWDISLQVLLSIAVTLLTGYWFRVLIHKYRYTIKIFLLLLVLLIVADLLMVNHIPYLWRYGLHGLFGVLLGIFFSENIFSRKFSKKFIKIASFISFVIFMTILGIVTGISQTYHFFLLNLGPDLLASSTYFIGFVTIFYLRYDLDKISLGWSGQFLKTLGEHSLFIYLVQISLIDSIVIIFPKYMLHTQWECFFFSILIIILCLALTKITDYARQYNLVNRFYRTVFQ